MSINTAVSNAAAASGNAADNAATAATTIKSGLTFCREYVELAGDLGGIGKAALIAAILLGFAYGIAEIVKAFRSPTRSTEEAPVAANALIDALKGLIEAMSKAPVWISLFAVGLLLFWIAGNAIPETCGNSMNEPYAAASDDGGKNTSADEPDPDANGAVAGNASEREDGNAS